MSWMLEVSGLRGVCSIHGGTGVLTMLLQRGARLSADGRRAFVVTDANVARLWGRQVLEKLGTCSEAERMRVVAAGERSKSVAEVEGCWDWLAQVGARRDDVLVGLGGGVVGDLAGFVAATYLRGMELWQVPTSLLAQVDSSVGGKNGVNLAAGKNLAGTFYQPHVVLADPVLLDTLPQLEFCNGLGEVAKYSLLEGEDLFCLLESGAGEIRGRQPAVMAEIVKRCVSYKAQVVEADEMDRGERATLNLGHTTAHALEKTLGFGVMGHGFAVALGLLVALAASEEVLGTDPSLRRRTRALLEALGLLVSLPLPPLEELLHAMSSDKKVSGKGLGFVGLRGLGEPVRDLDLSTPVLERALGVIAS
jgi:3-dehydroquinate synthase